MQSFIEIYFVQVITSFVGFWIEIPAAPARVTLAMTTLLTLVTSAKNSREKIPKVKIIF